MLRKFTQFIAIGLMWGTSAMAAMAADLPARADPPAPVAPAASAGWQFSVTPYMWAAGVSGDVGHGDRTLAHLDYDFSKIINTLNFTAMGMAEARYGRFSLSSDLVYLRITDHVAMSRIGLARSRVGVGMLQWTPLAGYAIFDDGRSRLELVAGARVWSVKTLIGAEFVRFGDREAQRTKTWVDAVGGVRGQAFLTDSLFLSGWALAGGGGSDYMWDVMGGVGYRFNPMFSASLGYRAQQVKFRQSGFLFDVAVHGPIASVQVAF